MRIRSQVLLVGTALAMLSAGNVVALTQDTISSSPATVSSGTYTPPAHDIGAAYVTANGACPTDPAAYSDSIRPFLQTGAIPVDGTKISQPDDLCLKNLGLQPVDISTSYTQLLASKETGACASGEAAGGDATCASLDPGEIVGSDLRLDVVPISGASNSCNAATNLNQNTTHLLVSSLPAGNACKLYFKIGLNPALSEAQRSVRQTDTVPFEVFFTGSDASPI